MFLKVVKGGDLILAKEVGKIAQTTSCPFINALNQRDDNGELALVSAVKSK